MEIMHIDASKDWGQLTAKEILYARHFIIRVFAIYLKTKGFCVRETRVSENDFFLINYECWGGAMSVQGHELKPHATDIFFMRYHDFPNIDDDYLLVTDAPTPAWTLGFSERIIYSFDRYLYDILMERGEAYQKLQEDSRAAGVRFSARPHVVVTGKMIAQTEEHNRKKEFLPCYLSFDRISAKEIKADLKRLLKSGRGVL